MKLASMLAAHAKVARVALLATSAFLIAGIALADFSELGRGQSLGLFYLLPVLIAATRLTRKQVLALAALCTLLREALGPLAWGEGVLGRALIGLLACGGAGLFGTEVAERRRRRLEQKHKLDEQATLRQDAEQQLRVLIETSPAAILTMDTKGRIMRTNQAAQEMLGFGQDPLSGELVGQYFPPLASLPQADGAGRIIRTTLECKARRRNGEIFPAHIWLSSFTTVSGPKFAAIVLDTAEELRDREALGFDQLMTSSRILVRAVSHEIRNLCAAIAVVHANLRRVPQMEHNEDFQALGTLVEGLGRLVSAELRGVSQKMPAEVNLREVLDELRIIIEPSFAEEESLLRWTIPELLPPVFADHHALLHIFMNLATNSQRALRSSQDKRLIIAASVEPDKVVVRFADSGPGVERPEHLFQPFRHPSEGAGLGLYLSRALARSFAGELAFEPQPYGSCFAVKIPLAKQGPTAPEPE
jgi:two-component system sensor kinase FixL